MGKYLNHTGVRPLSALGKAKLLIEDLGAELVVPPTYPPEPGKVLVCVVSNGPFEAAAVCDTAEEFQDFRRPDGRYEVWLVADAEKVEAAL